MRRFSAWVGLRAGEGRTVATLGAILFCNYAAMGITKVVAVSGFLSQVQGHHILLVWAIDMALLIVTGSLQSLVIDRFNRVTLLRVILAGFAALYVGAALLFSVGAIPKVFNYAVIYLLNDQQWRFFPVLFWSLAGDLFTPVQGRRLQPLIANFAFVGTLAGLSVAALDAYLDYGAQGLLLLNAAIFGLATLLATLGLRRPTEAEVRPPAKPLASVFAEGWEFIRQIPSFNYLAALMLCIAGVMTVLLYNALAEAKFALGAGFQSFYAWYNLAIAVGSVVLQTQAGRIIEKVQLKNAFPIQVVAMLGGVVAALFFPGVASAAGGQGVARVTYDTVDVSARKALQAFVPDERRGRVSMFIDSILPSLGTIVASLLTFAIIAGGMRLGLARGTYSAAYLGLAALGALGALGLVLKVRATYDASLLNWQLKRRQRSSSIVNKLDFD